MKKILVLGGTRFVGKVLVKKLLYSGHDVTVANRSGSGEFRNEVKNIIFNRNDSESIRNKLCKEYDVIYDMICYSPKNARDILQNISTQKYIMISSSVVYDWGINHSEEEFDAGTYSVIDGSIEELGKKFGYKQGYKLGKMGAEGVIAQCTKFPCIVARFPLILGANDHTQRLETYIRAIRENRKIYVDNLYSKVSMVRNTNAAEYLAQLCDTDIEGTLNLADAGDVMIYDLLNIIANLAGQEVLYDASGEKMGYNEYYSNTFDLNKMVSKGLKPENIWNYLHDLIEQSM